MFSSSNHIVCMAFGSVLANFVGFCSNRIIFFTLLILSTILLASAFTIPTTTTTSFSHNLKLTNFSQYGSEITEKTHFKNNGIKMAPNAESINSENPQDDSSLVTQDSPADAKSYHQMNKIDHSDMEHTYDGLAQKLRGMIAERQRQRDGQAGQKEETPHEQLWVALAGGPGSGPFGERACFGIGNWCSMPT
jgi:hypothetical protein